VLIDKQDPEVFDAFTLAARTAKVAAREAGLDRLVVELVSIRISQMNGCAYCLDVHVRVALGLGETPQRLAVLPAWRDTDLFTEKERAALALGESLTALPDHHLQDEDYAFAEERLTAEELSAVSWIAISMNAFNRLSIVSRHRVRERP
jgi:AhpD family alkylhydroperoxidase